MEMPRADILSPETTIALLLLLAAVVLLSLVLRRRRRPIIVVDGSNVMFWADETARLDTVRTVIDRLRAAGFRPVVWFDANAGYRLADRYLGPRPLARQLGLSHANVRVAPKGTPADPLLLEMASHLGAPVVSNDRFRDWAHAFPDIVTGDRMVRGRMKAGELRLNVR